jgi:anti-sigma B factor antagonist
MKFTAIPSSAKENEAYLCEFEGAANVENDIVAALASQLDVIIDQGIRWAIVDFSNVVFISSAGVGTLLSRRRKFKRSEGDLILCSVPDEIMYVLEELNLVDHMRIATNCEEAIKSVSVAGTKQSV